MKTPVRVPWNAWAFADPRAARAADKIGATLIAQPAHLCNHQRQWTPLLVDGKRYRVISGEWCGELGHGANDQRAIGFILKSRLGDVDRYAGTEHAPPWCALQLRQCYVFNDIQEAGEFGARLREIQRDTLAAVLKVNSIGADERPKEFLRNMQKLKTAGAEIIDMAIRDLPVRAQRRGFDDIAHGAATITISRSDESGKIVSRETIRKTMRDSGDRIERIG